MRVHTTDGQLSTREQAPNLIPSSPSRVICAGSRIDRRE